MQQHPFLKCVVLSDINTFETHEKGTLDKLYRKIPRELAVISLRKDFYDYRFMQKPEQALQRTESGIELHERVTHTLCRKYELFNTHVSYLVPVEYVKSPCLTIEETYSIALIRKDESDRFLEVTFQAYPFRL